MIVSIELVMGQEKRPPRKSDMQKNIDAIDRAISNKKLACDDQLLLDTKSILINLQRKLRS